MFVFNFLENRSISFICGFSFNIKIFTVNWIILNIHIYIYLNSDKIIFPDILYYYTNVIYTYIYYNLTCFTSTYMIAKTINGMHIYRVNCITYRVILFFSQILCNYYYYYLLNSMYLLRKNYVSKLVIFYIN